MPWYRSGMVSIGGGVGGPHFVSEENESQRGY